MGGMVLDEREGGRVLTCLLADEHLEGGLGGLELIAFAFEAFHLGEDLLHLRCTFGEFEAHAFGFDEHVRLAGHVGDGDDALVADEFGIDVLVGAGQLLHGVHMQSTFVREGSEADVGRTDVMRHVGELVHEVGEFAQAGEIEAEVDAHLDLQGGHDGDEVAVSDAFAVAVDRALHLAGTGAHGGQRIRHADAAVIVRVDAHGLAEIGDDLAGDVLDELGQSAAVCLAKDDEIGTGICGGLDGFERVFGVFFEAVEEVLGVVEHLAAVLLQVGDRISDHGEVFLESDLEDLGDVERPGLADDGDDGRLRIEEHFDLGIVLDLHFAATGHAKGGDLGVFPGALGGFLKEGRVFRVRTGPAAFDVVDAKAVEFLGDADLVERAEGDAGALRAVAQGGVVDGNRSHEWKRKRVNAGQARVRETRGACWLSRRHACQIKTSNGLPRPRHALRSPKVIRMIWRLLAVIPMNGGRLSRSPRRWQRELFPPMTA